MIPFLTSLSKYIDGEVNWFENYLFGYLDIDDCLSNPCRNEGICTDDVHRVHKWNCECKTGYLGADCSICKIGYEGDDCAIGKLLFQSMMNHIWIWFLLIDFFMNWYLSVILFT